MRIYTYLAFSLQVLGLLLFCRGFFPHKKAALQGYAERTSEDAVGLFDRLIFVVIDALRSDFAYGPHSSMHNLQGMISEGNLLPFTAKASTPTVTLPRLKCLTTGAITGFLDAILNIAESDSSSTIAAQDTWVEQLRRHGRRVHMFGDDTWLRLFPNVFEHSEGTSSFFVSDFTEVDNNVTRHLSSEMKDPEWDALILHYLGLDHIGHLEGPSSAHMPHKQREMDQIVSDLFHQAREADARDGRATLLVVVGDHGMTEDGNHGGASDHETHTAVAMISSKFSEYASQRPSLLQESSQDILRFHEQILQSDIVPALALFLGLPIPRNSLGIVPPSSLRAWEQDAVMIKALLQNARQLQLLLVAGDFKQSTVETFWPCLDSSRKHGVLSCSLDQLDFNSRPNEEHTNVQIRGECYRLMSMIQERLLLASNNYIMEEILVGLLCLAGSLCMLCYQQQAFEPRLRNGLTVLLPFMHAASAFASSFVEEEQVFWYYMGSVALTFTFLSSLHKNMPTLRVLSMAILPLFSFRFLRRYNQTGQKHAGAHDISNFFRAWSRSEAVFILLTAASMLILILNTASISKKAKTLLASALGSIIISKISLVDNPILLVRLSWLFIFMAIVLTRRRSVAPMPQLLVSLIFVSQSRPRNYPILALFWAIDSVIQHRTDIPWTIATYYALAQASFFAMGNSNSLSGLDLSQAYNGVSAYNETLVGTLLYLSTFIGPLFWQVSMLSWMRSHKQAMEARDFARSYIALGSCMYTTAICTSCYILRHHLFVFSVFSPKLLFTAAWTLFYGFSVLLI
ncbi:GPI ethanolamine phosphate transferase [Taphrina deformans PYCC 5710]|uniref:GPI ethanolamine phosphate transferase 2 n=1 Tax=Taphrina deformans (strain PYCC 5710 / ATCC 11124 / CBS 356.35 / IMI 108563 / JCM 9778 / NBRC 8474) TaxID=1097556 RepID=R4XEA2_TAPDE|nr:GPI ethanolamine phosphate transferase [Taphrina deformans PYCC 5710]|eukprot:CCG82796.1 GPI ethanolamine phosphate transferase [Taphrina deformans PYCC 5710]